VRHTVAEAIAAARSGKGPTVIEAVTYRLSDHTTADDATRYRKEHEVKDAWKSEPLLRFRAYLKSTGAWDDAREEALKAECAGLVDAAVEEYLHTPKQSTDAMFDFLFARLPKSTREQRDAARRYASSGAH
jgi:2-oxoisovalerate dehydrogenase E1 component alpha subunit